MKKKRRSNIFILLGELCFAALIILVIYSVIKLKTLANGIERAEGMRSIGHTLSYGVPSLVIPGSILLIFGSLFPLFTNARKNSSLVKNGSLTFGKLVATRPTGTSINSQPELVITLTFETSTGQMITAECLNVIPITMMANFQPGALLPIRYDINKPENIALDFTQDQASLQQALNNYLMDNGLLTKKMIETAKHGHQGQAVILSKMPTGKIVKGNPELTLTLHVTKDDGEQYEAEITKVMLAERAEALNVGKIVDVMYLPQEPQAIVITSQIDFPTSKPSS